MEAISVLQRTGKTANRKVKSNINRPKPSSEKIKTGKILDKMVTEGDENFLDYLQWHGLANEDNLLVLSSKSHYYYDSEELKEVTTLINLKKLNLIKHLDEFLHTICYGLSPKTNFIGCFSDIKSQKGISLTSRMYKRFINFLDSRIDIEIDSKDISKLLESHGFKIMDMTEINGMTYFRTQNYRTAV
jgi:hypothetical protein